MREGKQHKEKGRGEGREGKVLSQPPYLASAWSAHSNPAWGQRSSEPPPPPPASMRATT